MIFDFLKKKETSPVPAQSWSSGWSSQKPLPNVREPSREPPSFPRDFSQSNPAFEKPPATPAMKFTGSTDRFRSELSEHASANKESGLGQTDRLTSRLDTLISQNAEIIELLRQISGASFKGEAPVRRI